MEGNQQFCLKWNNYHVNIASSFDSLRVDEDFVDVTLACDGFQMKAHRMVLSACSPFFRQLLKSNPHPHPIVILRDVSQYNMELLLDFMYHGEVNVAQEQLAEFLKVAELLKVKGLADDKREEAGGSNGQSGGAATPTDSPAAPDEPPPAKRPRQLVPSTPPPVPAPAAAPPSPPPPAPAGFDPSAVKHEAAESETSEYAPPERGGDERLRALPQSSLVGEEGAMMLSSEVSVEESKLPLPVEASRGVLVGPGPSSVPFEGSSDPLMRLLAAADQQAGAGITLPSGVTLSALGTAPPAGVTLTPLGVTPASRPPERSERRSFPCFICGKQFGYPHHMRRHVETVHTLYPSYVFCPECGRVYKNKNSLSVHMSMYHNSQRRAAQREQALQAQAAAQAQAQAAAGAWQQDAAQAASAKPWPTE